MKYKAWLVAKVYNQKEGVDYNKIFTPFVRYSSICVLLSLVATLGMELEQHDVKTTFLQGKLEEDILMKQPKGFDV